MNYSHFAENNDFGGHGKLAGDLAFALDHPVADCTKAEVYGSPIKERTNIFNALCALCTKHDIAVPSLEDCIRKDGLLKKKTELPAGSSVFLAKAQGQLDALPAELKGEFEQLMHALEVIATIESYSGVSAENVHALMNQLLVERAGKDPIRPDYTAMKLPQHPESVRLDAQAKLLIVDDSASEILNSHLAASGIANLELAWLRDESTGHGKFENPDQKRAAIETMAAAIQEHEPRLVLMDQGLKRINGSDVVSFMKNELSSRIVFIANTGGNADDLYRAGCSGRSNFDKGKRPNALYEGLEML